MGAVIGGERSLASRRRRLGLAGLRYVFGVRVGETSLGGVPARTVVGKRRPPVRHVLWFHGGGFIMGSPETHLAPAGLLAKRADATVTLPRYRLAPEHPFPAAFEDALDACRAHLTAHDARTVVVAGDSAGGCLALAVTCALRDEGSPLPAALYLQSPFVDFTRTELDPDPFITQSLFEEGRSLYLGVHDRSDPRASPLFADLHGLPPTLVQWGQVEAIATDSSRLVTALAAAGVEVTGDAAPEMWHVYQQLVGMMPEAMRGMSRGVDFIVASTSAAA